MNIFPIRAFKDNYIWMFSYENFAWAVDPGDAAPVIDQLTQRHFELAGILLTHHHYDHSGGVAELVKHWKNIPVYASHNSQIQQVTHHLHEHDEINCSSFQFKILEIPGHTLDHIAYYNNEIVFCGDTLFSAGCGRVFEGTPALMYQSLSKLYQQPNEIKIYCAHEYTLSNLMFARLVEPDNQDIDEKIILVNRLLEQKKPTLPSLLSDEKKINPFLRCSHKNVIQAAENYVQHKLIDPVEVFAVLRQWKNQLS